jgi:regulator of sirC expression with transglutaminase-like and TPR domain
MKQVTMNKMILILMFLFCSCKNSNNADYDNSTMIDSSSIADDTSSSNNKNSMDDTVDDQIKRMQENKLSYEEVMHSNSVEDYENFIEHNPQHEKIENVKAKLIDLK